MKAYSAFALVAGLTLLGATEARASTVTFTIGEEDGRAYDVGTLTYDSSDPAAGTIVFTRFPGDEFSPPPFSATTVGPITISVTDQGGGLAIDASGSGTFHLGNGVTSGGTLSAFAYFFPDDPNARTLDGFGNIGAQAATGIAGAATNGTTLFRGLFLPPPSTVPLPSSAPCLAQRSSSSVPPPVA